MTNNANTLVTIEPESFALDYDALRTSLAQRKLAQFIGAHQSQGYRAASFDPLNTVARPELPELQPQFHELSDDDVRRACSGSRATTVEELNQQLKAVYCGPIGLDCSSVRDQSRRQWLCAQMEQAMLAEARPLAQQEALLQRLVQAEEWERFVQRTYPKAKRFSLEGCESLLPLMDSLVDASSEHGVKQLLFAMPHRGRLNLLVNLMQMPPRRILGYFDSEQNNPKPDSDLPFHLGYKVLKPASHASVELVLAHNPSHLESVYPVLLGMARAYQDEHCPGDPFPTSVVLHGDAAFCGQGVVMESLKMTQHRGYSVHGTIHVIINNQIGFTTANPLDIVANRYCTDIARIIDAPVLHVNADEPEAVVKAARIAFEYRRKFGVDVVIDLIGYRRWGHAEQDTATVTQPHLHALIDRHPGITEIVGRQLQAKYADYADQTAQWRSAAVQAFQRQDQAEESAPRHGGDQQAVAVTQNAMSLFVEKMTTLPPHFDCHPALQILIDKWRAAVSHEGSVADWCFAENMAYASLLNAGVNIRLSGMDVERGTFMHRHAAWHSQQGEAGQPGKFIPLQRIAADKSTFSIVNSPLSEEAVLGFEYGFSIHAGQSHLVIWEAQFGDFVNGAQIMVDQYISSGAAKWGFDSGLTMLLPHGYEGVGPEHSTAYISRFLLLCAENNMRVAYPSESAQWFHLLRGQAAMRKPLVVIAPKAQLYQKPQSFSPLQRMTAGNFQPLLADPRQPPADRVERVVICSGKVFYDIDAQRQAEPDPAVAILRLEQLYPFPQAELKSALATFSRLTEVVWLQEEDKIQGAWLFVREHLEASLPAGVALRHVCRTAAASGAHASSTHHKAEQLALVQAALRGQ